MIRLALAALLVMVVGCTGTQLSMTGSVCGEQVELLVRDSKDRSGFSAVATCPQGGGIEITSSDSSYSTVLAQQAQMLQTLTNLVAKLITPVPPAGMTARGAALERLAYTVEAEERL